MTQPSFRTLINLVESAQQGVAEGGLNPKERAKAQIVKMYGDGQITFRKTSNGGYFIQHEDDFGDTNSHQYDPQTGKVDFSSVTRSSYHGYSEGLAENVNLSIQQLATISDEALDKAYGYGRSTPGNTFGWQANLKSAAYAKQMIDKGITDIEAISDAIHKGWNVTAQSFVKNPDQFSDTEKLKAAGKLEAKLQQRAQLMKQNYAQLPEEEKEKDRVVARALLQAIKGQQDVAEEQLDETTPEAIAKIEQLQQK